MPPAQVIDASQSAPLPRARAAQAGDQRAPAAANDREISSSGRPVAWYRDALALSLLSGALLWASFPPLNLGWLAWAAPLGWLALIRVRDLPGRRPYLAIWFAGFVYWLVLLQFVRLPHWSTSFGWFALAIYLAFYPLAFVGLGRAAVHSARLPLVLAAPVVWTGLELLRSYLFTGFPIALLGHTQVRFPAVIQIADVAGCYGVSFVMMFAAACLASMWPAAGSHGESAWRRFWPAAPLAASIAVVLGYGMYRLNESPPHANDGRVLRVALIQGCFPTRFEQDYERAQREAAQNFQDYLAASERVCREHENLDLVVWPESMFTANEPDVLIGGPIEPPTGVTDRERFEEIARSYAALFQDKARYAARRINGGKSVGRPTQTQLLVGCETQELGPHRSRRFNSALHINEKGEIVGRYYKMHRVMFGEYVPFGEWAPWVYTLTPMGEGLTSGRAPQLFEVAGMKLAPSICFESTMPQLIRRQVQTLAAQGAPPDVLVNVTNDGWFWGSNALDLHLTCGIFRAIEQRRPLLIAANTGFSAYVNGNGTVLKEGPRFAEANLVAEVTADGRSPIYLLTGDLPAWGCLAATVLVGAIGLRARFRRE